MKDTKRVLKEIILSETVKSDVIAANVFLDTENSPETGLTVTRRDLENPLVQIKMMGAGSDFEGVLAISTTGLKGGPLEERMRIHTNGNVGIGTDNPKTSLHIPEQGLQIGTSPNAYNNFHMVSDFTGNNRGFRLFNGNYGAGTHLLTVLVDGRVGIGTTTPVANLDVTGGGKLNQIAVGAAPFGTLTFPYESIQLPTWANLRINFGSTETAIFTNDGKLGIGTPAPGAKLEVVGDILASDGIDHAMKTIDQLQINTTLRSGIYQNSGDGLRNAAGTAVALNNWWHVINMHHQHNNGYNAQIAVPLSASPSPNEIYFRTSHAGSWTDWRKVLSENSDGRVGIGTTNPGAKLDVSGSGGASQCCAPVPPTISLAEASNTAGRQAWLQFHNAGEAESYIRLAGGGPVGSGREGQRRLEIGDNQGVRTSLTITGNVGIGTNDPKTKLHVKEGDIRWGNNSQLNEDHGGSIELGGDSSTPGKGTPYIDFHYKGIQEDFNTRIINDANGRLSIIANTLSVSGKVAFGGTIQVNGDIISARESDGTNAGMIDWRNLTSNRGWHMPMRSGDDDKLQLYHYDAGNWSGPYININRNGKVGIGTNNPGALLHVNGNASKPGGGSWTDSSDKRLKKNIKTMKGALEKLLKLRGVSFEWKEPEKQGNLTGRQMGLVADEVEEVFPEWVGIDHEGYKNLTVRGFEALTIEAFRELSAANEELMAKNKELEERINALAKKIKTR